MVASKGSKGTMTLPSATAVALWHNEISGQISDGMWENSSPHDHYKFWCNLDVVVGDEAKVSCEHYCRKNSYALTRLHQERWDDGTYVLRDRMFACGRLAKAGIDPTDHQTLHASEYMPATLEEFRTRKANASWEHDYIAKYMDLVSDEVAVKYYAATYTLKELNADLDLIKVAMKTAKKLW